MKKTVFAMILLMVCILMTSIGFAHTPLCSCYDNGDGTITCEGGFSDGSSASGVEMRLVDKSGKVLMKGKMSEDSEFTFKRPSGPFKVQFDAGPGHLVEVEGKEISE
jgi:type 1 fimbria pilin